MNSKEKIRILSGAALKHMALVSMLCDHVNKALLINMSAEGNATQATEWLIRCFDILGRFALPVFAFLLVEGFVYTKSKVKYLRNLIVFALISEIPFNMFTGGEIFMDWHQNIYFTLSLGFCTIWLIDILKSKTRCWTLAAVPVTAVSCLIAMFGSFDYDMFGILTIVFLYLFRGVWFGPIVSFTPLLKTPWAILGYLTIYLYNGKRGKQCKWFNYWFYPVHLLILGILRMVLFS